MVPVFKIIAIDKMLLVNIDLAPIVDEFRLLADQSKELSSKILKGLVDQYMFDWEKSVSDNLNQTKDEYLRAINVDFVDEFNAVIKLDGRQSELALKIEDGADPWDIKEDLKAGTKVKTSKEGNWYVDVPFRFATSEALGSSPVFSATMPKQIQNIVKKISPKPLKQKDIPAQFAKPGSRKEIKKPFTVPKYDHKVSVYEGLRRIETGGRSGKYMSFRRVSDNSEDYSWIHPGLQARKFMDKTLQSLPVDDIVDNIVDNFLKNI